MLHKFDSTVRKQQRCFQKNSFCHLFKQFKMMFALIICRLKYFRTFTTNELLQHNTGTEITSTVLYPFKEKKLSPFKAFYMSLKQVTARRHNPLRLCWFLREQQKLTGLDLDDLHHYSLLRFKHLWVIITLCVSHSRPLNPMQCMVGLLAGGGVCRVVEWQEIFRELPLIIPELKLGESQSQPSYSFHRQERSRLNHPYKRWRIVFENIRIKVRGTNLWTYKHLGRIKLTSNHWAKVLLPPQRVLFRSSDHGS